MKKNSIFKSLISLMLALSICIFPLSFSAFAADDYPYSGIAAGVYVVDDWNFYKGECTSFVAFRLNNNNGVGFTNWYGGIRWGHANNWDDAARSLGIAVDNKPAVGAVAQSDSGNYGHVAWVSAVNGSNVTIEEYNYGYVKINGEYHGNHKYSTRDVSSSDFCYIHIQDLPSNSQPVNSEVNVPSTVSQRYQGSDWNEGWYEGEWKNGKPHGYGKLTYDDFDDGKYYTLDTDGTSYKAISYEGYFEDGYRSGSGTVIYEGGYREEGTFYGKWSAGKTVFEGKRWKTTNDSEGYWPLTMVAVSTSWSDDHLGEWVYTKTPAIIVSFDATGGTVPITDKSVTLGNKYGKLPTPTKEGYTFLGWGANRDSTIFYTENSIVSNSGNHTLYAVWGKINESVVSSLTIDKTNIRLDLGETVTLTATVAPSDAADAVITWTSSNSSVATVHNGSIIAVGAGTATITATAGDKSASCSVTVFETYSDVQAVTLSKSTLSLSEGETATISAIVTPAEASNASVTWISNNPSVATVNNGTINALSAGTATITATAGDKSATCSVNVSPKNKLQIGTATLAPATAGKAYSQTLVANSTDAVSWSVSNGQLPSGLTLSSNGVISGTPATAGTYTFSVTAKNSDGSDSKIYTLEVKAAEKEKADVHFARKNVYHQDQFIDVKANQWFTDTVASAFELGLMKGNSETSFNPYGDVTIAEAITMAARVHCINTSGVENFVQTGKWYQVYLDYAYQNGIIDYAYYNSDVTQKATRAQFAEIFSNSLPGENLYAMNKIADNAIPDVSMSEHYAGSVYKLYRAGILTGSDVKGSFNPQTYITRAEAATILSRMAESENRVNFSLS